MVINTSDLMNLAHLVARPGIILADGMGGNNFHPPDLVKAHGQATSIRGVVLSINLM